MKNSKIKFQLLLITSWTVGLKGHSHPFRQEIVLHLLKTPVI